MWNKLGILEKLPIELDRFLWLGHKACGSKQDIDLRENILTLVLLVIVEA